MTLPASIATGTVVGTWVGADGEPCSGCVRFTADTLTLRDASDAVVVHMVTVVATLDAAGSISQDLVATDNVGVTPTSWLWHAQVDLDNGAIYDAGTAAGFAVPAGETVNLVEVGAP